MGGSCRLPNGVSPMRSRRPPTWSRARRPASPRPTSAVLVSTSVTASPMANPTANRPPARRISSAPGRRTGSATAWPRQSARPSGCSPAQQQHPRSASPSSARRTPPRGACGHCGSLFSPVRTRSQRSTAVAEVDCNTITLLAPDDFTLGVAATRAEVALLGEGLAAALTRVPAQTAAHSSAPTLSTELLTSQPRVLIVFQ